MTLRGRRGVAVACLVLGLGVAGAAQVLAPLPGPPVYDGVVPTEPYVWLSPPPGDQSGAQGAAATLDVTGGASPLVAVATPELIPQAQIFAAPGSLTLPPGTTSLSVEIAPIPAPAQPPEGHVSGNVYRISVTDQAGTPITAPPSAQVSIVMRAADPQLLDGVVARFANGGWERLETSPAGLGGTFLAVVTEFGAFAVLAPQAGTGESPSPAAGSPGAGSPLPSVEPTSAATPATGWSQSITTLAAAGLAILVVLAIAAYAMRRAGRRQAASSRPRRRR